MRNLPIAYGNSCYAKKWPNKTTTFDDLCARLEHTTYTTETVEEYPKLSKADRDRAKDKGGFVGGSLRDNRRKRENVVCRSILRRASARGKALPEILRIALERQAASA